MPRSTAQLLDALLTDRARSQRDRLADVVGLRAALSALDDAALLVALRGIRAEFDSKKLRSRVDGLLGELRRDGQPGSAPLPKLAVPRPEPTAPSSTELEHEALRERLLRAIALDPRDREPRAVYRDWLEQAGLVEDGRVRLGPLAELGDYLPELEWSRGFVRAARVRFPLARFAARDPVELPAVIRALLDEPGPGALIERLVVGLVRPDANDYAEVCAAIGGRLRPALVELELGDFEPEECELNWTTLDATRLWAGVPNLRKLWLRAGAMVLDGLALPRLRELETVTGGLSPAALTAIASADWPELERMQLQIGAAGEGAATDVELLAPILAGERLPKLTHLGLRNCEFSDAICEALVAAPILRRLRSLDLAMGTLSDAGVDVILRHADAFRQLEHIDVDDNYLSQAALARLEALGPRIEIGFQREDHGGRYASAIE